MGQKRVTVIRTMSLSHFRSTVYRLIDVPGGYIRTLPSSDLVMYDMGRPISIPTSTWRHRDRIWCAGLPPYSGVLGMRDELVAFSFYSLVDKRSYVHPGEVISRQV